VGAVVVIVSVAVPGTALVMFTGLVEPKLKLGGYWSPGGLNARAAVSATLPVNPPAGLMVMIDVFPVVAPGASVMFVAPIAKPDGVGVTVTVFDPDAVL
jgi:hypothetical protein